MGKTQGSFVPDGATVENNPRSGQVDVSFRGAGRDVRLSFSPKAMIAVVNTILRRVMEREESESVEGLQAFALRDVKAKRFHTGQMYLEYKMENGLAFASGLPMEVFRKLHQDLGVLLAETPDIPPPARPH